MNLRKWYALRGAGYVYRRAAILLGRYGLIPSKAIDRVESLIATLAEYGCAPTLPTPGYVVERYPHFIRHLQEMGAEIAVHGYDHVDFRAYSPAEAEEQLKKAAEIFSQHGIEVCGFRCPYLSCADDLLDLLPNGRFNYSSNKAIWWDVSYPTEAHNGTPICDVLNRLYKPASANDVVCTPWTHSNMVEIPVSLPDDLQLHDGLHLGPEGITQVWSQILHRTHRRGELFVLQFHPELAWRCQQPLVTLLREATCLQPPVWIARLREISDWWREKSGFSVAISHIPAGLHISFICSERATILVRGLGTCDSKRVWDGAYYQLRTRTLDVPAEPHPFVGLPANAPRRMVSFLCEQGYILDIGEMATRCATYIDATTLAGLISEVELIDYIEASPGPLIRYWRWPGAARSAMCVTGDLDALTLLDYASRLLVRQVGSAVRPCKKSRGRKADTLLSLKPSHFGEAGHRSTSADWDPQGGAK